MTEEMRKIPIKISPEVAAVGFLKRFDQATKKDAEDLQQIFYWFEQQGREKQSVSDLSDHRAAE